MKADSNIKTYLKLSHAINCERRAGHTIVMVAGCYDILHLGHLIFLIMQNAMSTSYLLRSVLIKQ